MKIILLGPPGAGKGTQAQIISKKLGVAHISTGDMLRQAVQSGSNLGLHIKTLLEQGSLVPDDIIISLMQERLNNPDCKQGFLLDGYPRTVGQAMALQKAQIPIEVVLEIHLSDEAIIQRMSGRRIHPPSGRIYHLQFNPPKQTGLDDVTGEPLTQRSDDQEDIVKNRLIVYHQQTKPLVAFYRELAKRSQGKLNYHKIEGDSPVTEISNKIVAILTPLHPTSLT